MRMTNIHDGTTAGGELIIALLFLIPSAVHYPRCPEGPPISERRNVVEIAKFFGGGEQLREAVIEMQTILYAA